MKTGHHTSYDFTMLDNIVRQRQLRRTYLDVDGLSSTNNGMTVPNFMGKPFTETYKPAIAALLDRYQPLKAVCSSASGFPWVGTTGNVDLVCADDGSVRRAHTVVDETLLVNLSSVPTTNVGWGSGVRASL